MFWLLQREREKKKVNVRHSGMWMLWPFDNGSWVSLHSTEQFDRGLLPHGVRPQGNHEVRHLGDFIQVIRPLKHHFLDLERGKWCQVDVCDTVYMSRQTGAQRWVRFGPMEVFIRVRVKQRDQEMFLNSPVVQRKHPLISKWTICGSYIWPICGVVPDAGSHLKDWAFSTAPRCANACTLPVLSWCTR